MAEQCPDPSRAHASPDEEGPPAHTVNTTSVTEAKEDNNKGNGLELQIALDALAAGNTEPLRLHLLRISGIEGPDAAQYSIRTTPFKAEPEDENQRSKLSYISEMDNIGEPDAGVPDAVAEKQMSRVQLDIPDDIYKYAPLDIEKKEIRLLRLGAPDSENSIHTFEMQAFSLNTVPRFYALSYVWGEPEKTMPLPVNEMRVMVTQNLFHAIEVVFSRYADVWLWADGICINQEDLGERGFQVGLMGRIYGEARLVVACTGHHRYGVGGGDEGSGEKGDDEVDEVDGENTGDDVEELGGKKLVTNVDISDLDQAAAQIDKKVFESRVISKDVGKKHLEDISFLNAGPSQSAISLMNYLSRIWESDEDYTLKGDKEWKKLKISDILEDHAKIWLKLFSIWSEDWFYRSWVTQEAVLGKKVVLLIDDTACSLDFVMKFWDRARKRDTPEILKHGRLADEYARIMHLSPVSAMHLLRDLKHPPPATESDLIEDENEPSSTSNENTTTSSTVLKVSGGALPKNNFLNLLALFRMNLASDPRDKVYSFLGLAKEDPVAKSITPDYSEANSPATMYQYIATKFIESGRVTELLQYSGLDHQIPNLPSWVPDWSQQTRSTMSHHLYNCSSSSLPRVKISLTDPKRLLIRGAIVDTIKWNGMPWRYYSHDRDQGQFAAIKESPGQEFPPFTDEDSRCLIRTVALHGGGEYYSKFIGDEGLEVAVARTLCMDRTWRGERTSDDTQFLESFNAFQKLYGEGPGETLPEDKKVHWSGIFAWIWDFDEEEESELRRKAWPFEVALQEAHKGRRFCITKEGYMCTTPYNTERGDVVVLFEGFKAPFVLRKEANDWKIVGDCYFHGIMDGELLVPAQDANANPDEVSTAAKGQQFVIRAGEGLGNTALQEFGII